MNLLIGEIYCRSILSRSGLYGIDYSINPYLGCFHRCSYCYAQYMVKNKRIPSNLHWGEYVYAKINAPTILLKDLRRHTAGRILMSSVTDPYQPLELRYKLTRRILKILSRRDFEVTLLTKSHLVLRDSDIIGKFNSEMIEVGLTITLLNDELRRIFEPNSSSTMRRIEALRILKSRGIRTFSFLGPLIPIVCEWDLEKLLNKLSSIGVEYIVVDKLNIGRGNRKLFDESLRMLPTKIGLTIRKILSENYFQYYDSLKRRISMLADKFNLNIIFCY